MGIISFYFHHLTKLLQKDFLWTLKHVPGAKLKKKLQLIISRMKSPVLMDYLGTANNASGNSIKNIDQLEKSILKFTAKKTVKL